MIFIFTSWNIKTNIITGCYYAKMMTFGKFHPNYITFIWKIMYNLYFVIIYIPRTFYCIIVIDWFNSDSF